LTQAAFAAFVLLNLNALRESALDQAELKRSRASPDPVSVSDFTLARALPHLPASGTVGYLLEDFQAGNTNDLAGLFRTQFTLAPRIVVLGLGPEFVIASARTDGILPDVPQGYEQAYRFSAGLALYRRMP
jgi:hypothetical protein